MKRLHLNLFVVLFITSYLSTTNASTCEEAETSHVKLDLAKQAIENAKLLYPKCAEKEMNNNTNCSVKDRSIAHLNAALDLISEAQKLCRPCPETQVIIQNPISLQRDQHTVRPIDCTDIQSKGFNKSGVYTIWPKRNGVNSNKSIEVYCDMETNGGGWTVIQRRGDFGNKTSFYQDWEMYRNGFGNIQEEFWLGNENIFDLTNQGAYSVRFDLKDVKREYRYAVYNTFSIGNESSGYILNIHQHTGNLSDAVTEANGTMFSTKDRQNDRRDGIPCAVSYKSAFWFKPSCGKINLNGVYQPGVKGENGIWWYSFKYYECMYSVEIKIRRKKFALDTD